MLNLQKKKNPTKMEKKTSSESRIYKLKLVQMIKVIYAHECRVPGQITYRLIWINIYVRRATL